MHGKRENYVVEDHQNWTHEKRQKGEKKTGHIGNFQPANAMAKTRTKT